MEQFANLIKHRKKMLGSVLFVADLLFFGITNPDSVSSLTLFSGFLLLAATLFYGTWVFLSLAARAGLRVGAHERKAGLGVAGLMALLLALQSIGQLGTRDIAVAIPFALLVYAYVTYGQSSTPQKA